MKRTAAILVTSTILMGTTPIYAAIDEDYYGRSSGRVNVFVNNQSITDPSVPNFVMNNRTVVPLKAFGETIGAFVQQVSGGTVELIKPNVNLVVSEEARVNSSENRLSINPFSAVSVGQSITPHIYYVVDNAPLTDELYYKIVILDPYNKQVYDSSADNISTIDKGTGFVGISTLDEITFDKAGDYKVQFLMKRNSDDFLTVGQTIIKANG